MGGETIAGETVRLALDGLRARPIVRERRQPLMGGTGAVVIVGGSAALLDECFALADRCEAVWSRFLADSDISRLNRAGGRPTRVDPLTTRLILAMLEAVELTSGDFNPAILPDLVEAGYAASVVDPNRVTVLPPGAHSVARLGLSMSDDVVELPIDTTLDPGGIGKGLAADLVVEFALRHGAWGALAEFGGDVVAAGEPPSTAGWTVGVENAGDDTDASIVRLASGAIVTSSQTRRRWRVGNEQRHHLIDPKTGRSAETPVQTATVIAASGARAEAISKSAFLRDPLEYLAWVPTVGAAALLLCDNHELHQSENWGIYQ